MQSIPRSQSLDRNYVTISPEVADAKTNSDPQGRLQTVAALLATALLRRFLRELDPAESLASEVDE